MSAFCVLVEVVSQSIVGMALVFTLFLVYYNDLFLIVLTLPGRVSEDRSNDRLFKEVYYYYYFNNTQLPVTFGENGKVPVMDRPSTHVLF